MSYQKRRSRPAWGSRKIINRQEGRTLYQKTYNPQLLFTGTFRTIREQPNTEGQPSTIFLQILPPQDIPHYYSHTHQMDLKTHPDRKNRPQCCIPARPHKFTDSSNMHRYCNKNSFSLSALTLWHHTRASRIYHHH